MYCAVCSGLHIRGDNGVAQGWSGDRGVDLADPLGHLGVDRGLVSLPVSLLKLLAHHTHGSQHVRHLYTGQYFTVSSP